MAEDDLRTSLTEPGNGASTVPVLRMQGIRKSFSGVEVLHGVDLTLYRGEVLALLGENGAGKSTLIKILNGDYSRDAGEILIDGNPVELKSPREAEHMGISVIYQELNYAPDLSVAENVLVGHLPHLRGLLRWFIVDWRETYRRAEQVLGSLKADVNLRQPMRLLSIGKQQTVEIAKALSIRAKILVMDEPTAALTPHEVNLLFETIARLRDQGVAIIYISHRLDEVEQIAQRVTVLRDGNVAGTVQMNEVTRRDLVRMMVGRDLATIYPTRHGVRGDTALEVAHLSRQGAFTDVSFTVREGEIVGLFGLLGAGHAEVIRSLFADEPATSGEIKMHGTPVQAKTPQDVKRLHVGFVPEDRKVDGLVLDMSVAENITIANWRNLSRYGVLRRKQVREKALYWTGRLGIRAARGIQQEVRTLSGGNQQKAVLARWLETGTRLLLLNEPTRGVDIGARADIYAVLEELREQGMALLLVSSDMDEVLSMSDRVLVFAKGRLVAEFEAAQASQERLLSAAAGGDE
jgi:ABC-type sugar transport system ATPase subunit